MLYLNLCSKLTIESDSSTIIIDHISSAQINRTVEVLGDKAIVTVPYRYSESKTREELKKHIKVGSNVKLELGYNEELYTEFEGYIRLIESGFPMKLHLDDETYPLSQTNYIKSWAQVSLKEVLTYIAPGYTIECHNTNLGKYQIDSESALVVIRDLKDRYGFYTAVRGKKLICKFKYEVVTIGQTHVYDFQKNVKSNDLKYRRREDKEIRIKAISYNSSGKKITETVGSKKQFASVRTLSFVGKTKEQLKESATAEYNRLCYEGFEGTVTGFGWPRTLAGDILELRSNREPERNGRYMIESVTVRYGNAYYERRNKLSYKQQ